MDAFGARGKMETVEKRFTASSGRKILKIYKCKRVELLPRIVDFKKDMNEYIIRFEWINGKQIESDDLSNGFYNLGKFHKTNLIKRYSDGLKTICHGDFHTGNIVKTIDNEYRFIDVTYLNIGWNYSDLEYIDFYDLYNTEEYPWMIKNKDLFDCYLDGANIKLNNIKKNEIIRKIVIKYLKKCIKNGNKNGVNSSIEEKALKYIRRGKDI